MEQVAVFCDVDDFCKAYEELLYALTDDGEKENSSQNKNGVK